MWIRAKLRHAPPTALKLRAPNRPAMGRRWRSMAARILSASGLPPSATEKGPSGRVTPRPGSPSTMRVSSRLAPPRSPTRPVAFGSPASTPQRRIAGLLLAGEHPQVEAGAVLDPATEGGAVGGVAHRGRGDREHRRPAWPPRSGPGTASRRRWRPPRPSGDSRPVTARSRPRPRQNLLVVDGPDRPAFQPIENQTHRIAADIDDRPGVAVGDPICEHRTPRTRAAGPLTLWPRPDSDGLVMNILTGRERALSGPSPASGDRRPRRPEANSGPRRADWRP